MHKTLNTMKATCCPVTVGHGVRMLSEWEEGIICRDHVSSILCSMALGMLCSGLLSLYDLCVALRRLDLEGLQLASQIRLPA